jgi:hypothetical protein
MSADADAVGRTPRDLVSRLAADAHPVALRVWPQPTTGALLDRVRAGVVHVTFVSTDGGTDLPVRLGPDAKALILAALAEGLRTVRISGQTTVDDVDVACVADVDVATLSGTAKLQPIHDSRAAT